jgi:phage tail tape-measure protein
MESDRETSQEHGIGIGGSHGSSQSSGTAQPSSSVASAVQRARQEVSNVTSTVAQTASDAYEQTRQVVGNAYDAAGNAYDKTTDVLNEKYEQAKTYGRENPGKTSLIVFAAGIGVGILLASLGGTRRKTSRIVEPVVNALSEIALEVFR